MFSLQFIHPFITAFTILCFKCKLSFFNFFYLFFYFMSPSQSKPTLLFWPCDLVLDYGMRAEGMYVIFRSHFFLSTDWTLVWFWKALSILTKTKGPLPGGAQSLIESPTCPGLCLDSLGSEQFSLCCHQNRF